MTKPARTTGSGTTDNAAVDEVMHRARELAVSDRATLAVGLVGHLATVMSHGQMEQLIDELRHEVDQPGASGRGRPAADSAVDEPPVHEGVGQGGRGEFRARQLL